MSVEVFATNEEIPVEDIGNELEIEFVDSMEALDDDLEKKQAGELANGNSLKCHEIPNVVISDEDRIGEELKSSRIDGISTASSDQSVTVSVTGTISEEGTVSYLPVALAPGDIVQATLEVPTNADLDYDLLLYAFDNNALGDYIKGSTLSTYMNTYPDGTTKSVDEGIAYINTDNVNHTYAVIVYPAKGYSAADSYRLTISIDQAGYYDASEPNESPFDVKSVTSNMNIEGHSLNVSNDQDWFVIRTTGLNKMGFIISESDYKVEVYYAVNTEMRLVNPVDEVYNISEGDYYIKVYNKDSNFESKEYSLQIVTYGDIPARIEVYYDGDMGWNVVDFTDSDGYFYSGYRYYQILNPGVRVFDNRGGRVVNAKIIMKWTSGGRRLTNGEYESMERAATTDNTGAVKFRMVTPTALGVNNYGGVWPNRHYYDLDLIQFFCGDAEARLKICHMKEK
ncbi:MAG: hypothetical protein K2P73_13145 [Lachnospiraceae bacterium]|nr:hypothetical protein [Lachnospiraceae bacterium]